MTTKNIANNYYAKLPNRLFYVTEKEREENKNAKSILEHLEHDNKVVPILEYLYTNTNRKGITGFTIKHMVTNCGFKPKSGKKAMNGSFKDILIHLQGMEVLKCDMDLSAININDFIECEIDLFDKDSNENDIRYFQIYENHKKRIYSYKSKGKDRINHLDLYTYYCYLNCRMYKREGSLPVHAGTGGRSEVCFPSYEVINEDVGLADDSIKRYNDILVELDLIRVGNPGHRRKRKGRNKKPLESPNIYTLFQGCEEMAKINLEAGIEEYKLKYEDEWEFIDTREYISNNRSLIGFVSRIDQLEREGKASHEQIEERNEKRLLIKLNEEGLNRKSLIEEYGENENKLLSDICYELYFDYFERAEEKNNDFDERDSFARGEYYHRLFEKYERIEKELGLVKADEETLEPKLTVDYKYYRWIMLNYSKESDFEKYKNYVAKEIGDSADKAETEVKTVGTKRPKQEVWSEDNFSWQELIDSSDIESLLG